MAGTIAIASGAIKRVMSELDMAASYPRFSCGEVSCKLKDGCKGRIYWQYWFRTPRHTLRRVALCDSDRDRV
jgi:hypothetical protein